MSASFSFPVSRVHTGVALCLLLTCFTALPAAGQLTTRLDTLVARQVGPGMSHFHIHAPEVPWNVHVVEIDLKDNPHLKIQTVKAGDRLVGSERTSAMAARNDRPEHRVVAAMNGDFYGGGGVPLGLQLVGGEFVRNHSSGWWAAGFDADHGMMIEMSQFQGTVRHRGQSRTINNINSTRNTDNLILYNRFMGSATGTNEFGTEVVVRNLTPWAGNDSVRVVVENVRRNTGSSVIPAGGAVLSGHGQSAAFLNSVEVGDEMMLFMGIVPGIPGVREVISGQPLIVQNGVRVPQSGSFAMDLHPRTGIGFNADTSKAYFVTVDGRHSSSAGMSLPEFADLFITIGAYRAANLDGGGSTTMVVRGSVVNRFSDSVERSIANAILVVSTAPEGALSRLQTSPTTIKLFQGRTSQITLTGADEYFNPREIDLAQASFTVDSRLGSVTPQGLFTAGTSNDTGYVYIDYGALRDSVAVIVTTVDSLRLTPRNISTDTLRAVQFLPAIFDQDRILQSLPATVLQWSSSDASIGTVDAMGLFHGRQPGVTWLHVAYGGARDSVRVSVDVQQGRHVLEDFSSMEVWSLSGSFVNLQNTRIEHTTERASLGEGSLALHYEFTHDTSVRNDIYLQTDIDIEGVPDAVAVDMWTDGRNHQLFFIFEDALGNEFSVSPAMWANPTGGFGSVYSAMSRAVGRVPGYRVMYHPIRLTRLEVRLFRSGEPGSVVQGSMWIDNLRVTYPATITNIEDEAGLPTGSIELFPNYPNPFERTTTVSFRMSEPAHARLVVYDLLGREVFIVRDGFEAAGIHTTTIDAGHLPSGMYMFRLYAGEQVLTRAMTVLR
jgi:hypothetical protein